MEDDALYQHLVIMPVFRPVECDITIFIIGDEAGVIITNAGYCDDALRAARHAISACRHRLNPSSCLRHITDYAITSMSRHNIATRKLSQWLAARDSYICTFIDF